MISTNASQDNIIKIGRAGEFGSRQIEFDLSDFEQYGAGAFELLHQRAGDFDPYVAEKTEVIGNKLIWKITAADTAYEGSGAAEIHLYSGDMLLAKSQTYVTFVEAALGEPPIATDMTTVDTVTAIAAQARGYMLSAEAYAAYAEQKADTMLHPPVILQNGNWGVWNGTTYADSGMSSVGAQGMSAYEYAQDGGYEGSEQQFYNDLGSLATKASEAAASASDASGYKEDAEAYAVGKRSGNDVASDDPAYHNNAKYYAGLANDAKDDAETAKGAAEDAQGAAEDAQGAAETAADNAKAFASGQRSSGDVTPGDPAYHNNAKYYADLAKAASESIPGVYLSVVDGQICVTYEE